MSATTNPVGPARFSGHTIDEMLVALRRAAMNEAIGLEALEIEAARHPHSVIATTITDVRRHGVAIGAAHALLIALAPHAAMLEDLLRGER